MIKGQWRQQQQVRWTARLKISVERTIALKSTIQATTFQDNNHGKINLQFQGDTRYVPPSLPVTFLSLDGMTTDHFFAPHKTREKFHCRSAWLANAYFLYWHWHSCFRNQLIYFATVTNDGGKQWYAAILLLAFWKAQHLAFTPAQLSTLSSLTSGTLRCGIIKCAWWRGGGGVGGDATSLSGNDSMSHRMLSTECTTNVLLKPWRDSKFFRNG